MVLKDFELEVEDILLNREEEDSCNALTPFPNLPQGIMHPAPNKCAAVDCGSLALYCCRAAILWQPLVGPITCPCCRWAAASSPGPCSTGLCGQKPAQSSRRAQMVPHVRAAVNDTINYPGTTEPLN